MEAGRVFLARLVAVIITLWLSGQNIIYSIVSYSMVYSIVSYSIVYSIVYSTEDTPETTKLNSMGKCH